MNSIKRIVAAAILLFEIICPAEARISRQTVSRAWHKITQAANFKELPIQYEADEEPNAWVAFGSDLPSVHVTASLLEILDTEEEIAGVLGHEVGHIKLGHYNSMILTDTTRTIMETGLENADEVAQVLGVMDMDLKESKFSRQEETDADNYGTEILVKAGYDPWGLYNAMKRFDDIGLQTLPNGFNSHPPSKERLANLASKAREHAAASAIDTTTIDEIISVLMTGK